MKNSAHPQTVAPVSEIFKSKDKKKTFSNVYSITVRDGCGVDLGVKPHSDFISYIVESGSYYVVTIEKEGTASHFQVGAIFPSPIRQDVLRSDILNLYKPLHWNEKQRKYAVEVKPHHDPQVLFKYCVKERSPLEYKGWMSYKHLIGCFCYAKHMICRFCDPFKQADFWKEYYSHKGYPVHWSSLWWNYEQFGYSGWYDFLRDNNIINIYGPLYPAPPSNYIRPILPDYIRTESISEPERCSVALPSPEEGGVRSNERSLSDF